MSNDYPSYLLEKAVEAFNSLPGIGRRTALRLALHILRQPKDDVAQFAESISHFREEVKRCSVCHNISDNDICDICSNPNRDKTTICVVQNVQDAPQPTPTPILVYVTPEPAPASPAVTPEVIYISPQKDD